MKKVGHCHQHFEQNLWCIRISWDKIGYHKTKKKVGVLTVEEVLVEEIDAEIVVTISFIDRSSDIWLFHPI